MHRILRTLCAVAAFLILSACSLPGVGQPPAATLAPPPSPEPTAALAPDLDAETLVEALGVRLSHPQGWVSEVISGTLVLAPSASSLDRTSPGPDLLITLDATPSEQVAAQYGREASQNPEAFFEVSSALIQQSGYTISPTTPITITGQPALLADLQGTGGSGQLVVVVGPQQVVRVVGQSDPASWAQQSVLFQAILESLTFFPLTPTPTPTPVNLALQPDVLREGPAGFVLRIGGNGGERNARFMSARGMATAPDGTLYVAENSRGIWVFAPDGSLLSTFGAEELLDAYDVVRTSTGDLFVADYGRNAIAHFHADGTFIAHWGSAGEAPDQFGLSSPQRIALGPEEQIYALDSRSNAEGDAISSVMIFQPDGTFVTRLNLPSDLAPSDLVVDSVGNIYLAESFGGSVVKLAPDGSELARFGDPAATLSLAAGSIDLDAGGDIYLATYSAGIVRLSPSGVTVSRNGTPATSGSLPGPGEFSLPNGIVVGPGEVVWVSDNSGEYSAVTALRLQGDAALSSTPGPEAEQSATPEPTVVPEEKLLHQWASAATASSFYAPDYDPEGVLGAPDVAGCQDSPAAWASAAPDGRDTLELSYATPVFASSLVIYQNSQPGFVSHVELIDERGEVIPVYTGSPSLSVTCPLAQSITFTQTLSRVVKVRITIDQRGGTYWSEIDAVELIGLP
ncbi:NHL repeat-containing protein [Candidatus Oscillochloris fontis]|uniref:NHL repeat-containing protein n=1 Tax=Candidatus Oscillochloris fontis TaxID=2496868 RepID=UPI00101CA27F|nr:NHL repeat-containing protein [Candidatus Oscillochloris fontis]